jgi:hypothetical protein
MLICAPVRDTAQFRGGDERVWSNGGMIISKRNWKNVGEKPKPLPIH